jgi:hypothetical protein
MDESALAMADIERVRLAEQRGACRPSRHQGFGLLIEGGRLVEGKRDVHFLIVLYIGIMSRILI